jgi:serine/threonine protein phosphatase 1
MNYIIGDIHGAFEMFDALLAKIADRDSSAHIYCVGDFCDRGKNTNAVVERILSANNIHCVRGNHDDIFDCILSGKPTRFGEERGEDAPLAALDWFMQFGMYETFESYGVSNSSLNRALHGGLDALATLVNRAVPETHRKFFNDLPIMIERESFFIGHASIPTECDLKDLSEGLKGESAYSRVMGNALLWGRYSMSQIHQDKQWGKTGYFGHTPTSRYMDSEDSTTGFPSIPEPIFGKDIVLVDTGAAFGYHLTAVCHETKEVFTS